MRLSHKPRSVRPGEDDSAMAQNFIECDREQAFLMPPSLREWLPEDHLACSCSRPSRRWT